ncbi:MAG: CDP-alcohol phosphatidyltransferase family protein [Gammaproteobacteria bacterium]|nr:CDP-alcohol phosphatidyltransferase family protein [Gammaproteobacteria bacterium]
MILKHLPNIISFLRLCLIVPFLICLYDRLYQSAFYVFILAGLTDGIDGWLARYLHCQTELGRFIDPMADKSLIACAVFSLALLGQLPWWLVVLILAKDATLTIGAFIWYRRIEKTVDFSPSKLSKFNTFIQISLVALCLIKLAFTERYAPFIPSFILLTAFTTTLTYIDYVWTWGQKACALKHQKH